MQGFYIINFSVLRDMVNGNLYITKRASAILLENISWYVKCKFRNIFKPFGYSGLIILPEIIQLYK
jgi:hypothetical protein